MTGLGGQGVEFSEELADPSTEAFQMLAQGMESIVRYFQRFDQTFILYFYVNIFQGKVYLLFLELFVFYFNSTRHYW